MKTLAARLPFALFSAFFLFPFSVHAQSFARLTLDPWTARNLAETYDHPILELHGTANNNPSGSQMFMWDSYGRVRFSRDNQDSPFVAYRVLTTDAGTDSRFIKSTMDEFDVAIGVHWGDVGGWRIGSVLGAGYSSTHPFVHTSGIFGIGHLLAEKKLDDSNSIVASVDYEGNGGFLPDIPLPGFAYVHHDPKWDLMLGYPMNKIAWRPLKALEITAKYTVPFTADIDAEYRLATHFGIYGEAGNFFQGFVAPPHGDITNRQFFQMRTVEAGVRFIFTPLIDGAVGLGYAFDQGFSRGFDVRDMQPFSHISNEPYLAITLHGTF